MPQASIDPVVMAAATVLRLQTIVSRELAPTEAAVVTIGALQAGTKENVIPDEAIIKLNVRTFDEGVRKRVLAAIERIVNAEAAASGAPKAPEITPLDRYALVVNDADASRRVAAAFRDAFLRHASTRDGANVGERGLRFVRRANGTCRRYSGSSAEPIPTSMRKRRRRARSTRSPATTIRASRR